MSFCAAFVKTFIVDKTKTGAETIQHPRPKAITVRNAVEDPVTGAVFPYLNNKKYVWPVTGDDGDFVRPTF